MSNIEDIFSIRIVIADFYIIRPTIGLDPCYSEFRGNEVKQIPVIRIFGSTRNGKKTCMHIHGVFPYFYVPYESSDLGDVDKVVYQLASSLDKAINISLGQGNSKQQHIFKIQLVKGIPFYGYHRKEHQFLKIYLYNPRFIKKAANLFQNGVILGKIFQPHESHVPYVLQFFIDYNLYGMSFLHVPKEFVKYRTHENDELLLNVDKKQILDENICRISVSHYEIDIAAAFILNRYQTMMKTSENTNPGIESIWQDERSRRQKINDELIPRVEIPTTQERIDIHPTNSDIFYKTALRRQLIQMQTLDETLNSTLSTLQNTEKKQTFNLKKLLSNSIYPEECSQELEGLVNASTVMDHLSSESVFHSSLKQFGSDSPVKLDESLVDEELVLSLTQNKWHNITLHEQDFDLLEVMKNLEEADEAVDLDSTLAPLSQTPKYMLVCNENPDEPLHNVTLSADKKGRMSDSDEDSFNDFTSVMDDFDDILANLTQNSKEGQQNQMMLKIPQVDGMNDVERTPKKKLIQKISVSSPSRLRSRSSLKYTPLNIIKTRSKLGVNEKTTVDEVIEISSDESDTGLVRRKTNVRNTGKKLKEMLNEPKISHDFNLDNERTFITCNLRARRNSVKDPPILRVFLTSKDSMNGFTNVKNKIQSDKTSKPSNNIDCIQNMQNNITTPTNSETNDNVNRNSPQKFKRVSNNRTKTCSVSKRQTSEKTVIKAIKKCKVRIKRLSKEDLLKYSQTNIGNKKKKQRRKSWSPSDVAREYDRRNNFFPEPGPSHINYYRLIELPIGCKTPKNTKPNTKCRPGKNLANSAKSSYKNAGDNGDDLNICSFYEKSLIVDSPSLFSDCSPILSNDFSSNTCKVSKINSLSLPPEDCVIITPKELPPSFDEVTQKLAKFDIPEVRYIKPFYSNNVDVTNKKEIGNTVLQISGNSLKYCEDFISLLSNVNGINTWRRNLLKSIGGESLSNQLKSDNSIKEYFSSQRKVTISTRDSPPTYRKANIWLKAREIMGKQNEQNIMFINDNGNSPTTIRRETVKSMCVTEESNEDNECIQSSLSLSPLPSTPDKYSNEISTSNKKATENSRYSMRKNRSNGSSQDCKDKLSLSNKLKKNQVKRNRIFEASISCVSSEKLFSTDSENDVSAKSSQKRNDNVQINNSLSSDVVIKNLENSSFIKNLNLIDKNADHNKSFGISGNSTFGFKVNLENLQNAKSDIEHNYLTVISLEVFVQTREDLKPNPEFDAISSLFFSIINNVPDTHCLPSKSKGFIIVDSHTNPILEMDSNVIVVKSEMELFDKLLELCKFWDPDILAGYEIEMNSWGYVIDRAKVLKMNLMQTLSRIPSQKVKNSVDEEREQFSDLDIEMKLCGRILLDVWRMLRSEIALTSYSFENVMYHILHRRCPLHSFRDLTKWFQSLQTRWIVLEYYLERVAGTLELLEQLDLIGRTSEMAKLIGIQFYEVLSRGSQFRVESMMLRIAKPKNLVPLSPSVQQRAHMRAPEYLPLILEPQSRLYVDPLIVLDFQSLYPSIIIAYNYCFSTCLGRVEYLGQSIPFEFGASQLRISPTELKKFIEKDLITISPCGVVFVKSNVREGILPRMLQEILNTRLMVKQSMKIHKTNSILQRVLHARQLGLKLIANVTYGYTAANFSGRMPSVEVGDSVVAKGRETLERAIKLVESNEKWRVKVVYGDTDSLFVLVPGRSREDAFKIGKEIAEAVTNDNPNPIKLKLEKVYHPSLLQTKKRYVGYMYESADQQKPIYEAKGIETVRRDGCPAVAKMLEKCLRILFETCDVSAIKEYVCRQFTKLLSGRANMQDLIFAKEFRGRNGYKPTACVPALELTRKWLQIDPRNEPRKGERVPFIIVNGPPGVPLIRLVRSPHEFLKDEGLKINSIYYITKAIIPPLNRCLLLIGANVNEWFADLPRKYLVVPTISKSTELLNFNTLKKSTISQYFVSTNCVIDCGNQTKSGICAKCLVDKMKCSTVLSQKISNLERNYFQTYKICQSCCSRQNQVDCESLDCPVLYILNMKKREQKQIQHFRSLLEENF